MLRCLPLSLRVVIMAVLVPWGAGCSYPQLGRPLERAAGSLGLAGPGEAFDPPQIRMGVMPFKVWYSPYVPLGIADLGEHRYIRGGNLPTWRGEASEGTMYTRDGGFLDIGHIRNSIDLTRYIYPYIMEAFDAGRGEVRLLSAEPDLYVVKLTPPAQWDSLRDQRMAAIRIAGRLAHLMTTWHEVITWYGYSGIVVTEKPSAFSYDDAPSHMVGVIAAMRALTNQPNLEQFDRAVTESLAGYLEELGAVPSDEVAAAMKESKDDGWAGLEPKRRVIHLGIAGEPLHPILHGSIPTDSRVTWSWPRDETVGEHRVDDLYDVWIKPATFQAGAIRKAAGIIEGARPIHPRSDFPTLRTFLLAAETP